MTAVAEKSTDVESEVMKVLLERRTAGFNVEVGMIPTTGEFVLKAWTGTYHAKAPILPEQVMTAYKHPCVFLPYPDRFFRDLKEGEAADETAIPREGPGLLTVDASDPMDYCLGCNQSLMGHEVEYCSHCSDDGS